MSKLIKKYVALGKEGEKIIPKDIPGYITPEGEVLREDGQRFQFKYTPINYNITYNLNGGEFEEENVHTSYTVEDDDYIPPIPIKEDYKFNYWEPEKLVKGSIGDIEFKANWTPNAILKTGEELNSILDRMAEGKEHIFAFQRIYDGPMEHFENVSSTANPIYFSYSEGVIYIYSKSPIYCNVNMSGAFEGLTLLRNINCLQDWICKENTNISKLFKNCRLLSDTSSIENWANGVFSDFSEAFENTSALEAGRVPVWYRWNVIVNHKSSTEKLILTKEYSIIPNSYIYAESLDGYRNSTISILINDPDIEYDFIYDPIKYEIRYNLNGGELLNPKLDYTIEDETYYPPEPIKSGYQFTGWNPECINEGQIGNVSFIANYKEI